MSAGALIVLVYTRGPQAILAPGWVSRHAIVAVSGSVHELDHRIRADPIDAPYRHRSKGEGRFGRPSETNHARRADRTGRGIAAQPELLVEARSVSACRLGKAARSRSSMRYTTSSFSHLSLALVVPAGIAVGGCT